MRVDEIKFYYINCQTDINKKENMLKQWELCCQEYGAPVPLERRDAVHFFDYAYPYLTESFYCPESKIKNQVSNLAVLKSHFNLWKYIYDNDIKYAFIFEDDAIIPSHFLKTLEESLNNPLTQNTSNWDAIYFGILRMNCQKTIYENFNRMLNLKGYNNGLHAYLIHKKTAEKFIFSVTHTGPENQIDIYLRDRADKYKFFVYKELLVKQDVENFESTRLGRYVKDEFKKTFDEITIT